MDDKQMKIVSDVISYAVMIFASVKMKTLTTDQNDADKMYELNFYTFKMVFLFILMFTANWF